jgi:anti-sigma factor RsiW
MTTDRSDQLHSSTSHPGDALAAYALGVLDADERAAVEAHLAGCASCRAELARQEEVAGLLGLAAEPVPPSRGLRDALLSEIREKPIQAAPRTLRPRIVFLAAAAIALVSIVVLAALLARTIDQRDDARLGEQEIAEYISNGGTLSALIPAPDAPADVRAGHGTLAVAPSQDQAMLVVHGLNPSVDGRGYMAWAERDGDRVRLGELKVDADGVGWLVLTAPEPMSAYDTVGITRFSPDAPDGEPFLVAPIH